jgi:hypothetical protein
MSVNLLMLLAALPNRICLGAGNFNISWHAYVLLASDLQTQEKLACNVPKVSL